MTRKTAPKTARKISSLIIASLLIGTSAVPAMAKDKKPKIALTTCTQSYGTIAIVDGDTQGWSEFGLGSPRDLINSLAIESGCFTPHTGGSAPATYLMNVIAGEKEEVDQSINLAKTVATEGLLRSGAAGAVLSKVPLAGALMGAFGGFGGKKKTLSAGIKLLSPANGQTIALGSGEVKKTSIKFGNNSGGWVGGAAASGYSGNKKGKMLVEAFVIAFNAISAQGPALASMTPAASSPAPAVKMAEVAVDTAMRGTPKANGAEVRTLRSGTTLSPTGKREGLFIEVEDNFGTKGWVSVEDLK